MSELSAPPRRGEGGQFRALPSRVGSELSAPPAGGRRTIPSASLTGWVGIVRPPPAGGRRTIPSASLTGWVGFRLPDGSHIYKSAERLPHGFASLTGLPREGGARNSRSRSSPRRGGGANFYRADRYSPRGVEFMEAEIWRCEMCHVMSEAIK